MSNISLERVQRSVVLRIAWKNGSNLRLLGRSFVNAPKTYNRSKGQFGFQIEHGFGLCENGWVGERRSSRVYLGAGQHMILYPM
ncbi:MAG: hypothetical protein GTO18_08055 [Anaerolineales bacterium]|nr:hypothetical protein [Anaerolineales bacterium]